ncbi:MAG: hypothetical protein LAN37_00220 [Acidobacteriia bacterium]|nr:hypothetical protein [Terriglobia bacterium]
MEKQIGVFSYWLGLLCSAVAIIWRGLIVVGLKLPEKVGGVFYESFLKLGALLLLMAVASAAHGWLKDH